MNTKVELENKTPTPQTNVEREQTGHTKGPWKQSNQVCQGGFKIVGPHNEPVCVCSVTARLPIEDKEANAQLIAAAPELLEACKELEARLAYVCSQEDSFHNLQFNGRKQRDSAIEQARAAIKQAEGRAE